MATGAGSATDLEDDRYALQRQQAKVCPLGASLMCASFLFIMSATLFPDCEALACPTMDGLGPTHENCPDDCELIVDGRTNTVKKCNYPIPDGECPPEQQTGGTPVFFWVLVVLFPVAGVGLYVKQIAYINKREAAEKEQVAAREAAEKERVAATAQMHHNPAGLARPMQQQFQQFLSVVCPPGVSPGGMLQIQHSGVMLQVQVPPGVQPGMSFQVNV